MNTPNFYEIVYEWMIAAAFEIPHLHKYLKADIERMDNIQIGTSWGELKQRHPWYAEVVSEVEDFLESNFKETGLGLGHAYDIFPQFRSTKPPKYWQDCKADFMVIIEKEYEEDETTYQSVDSLLSVKFNQNGDLTSLEVEEELTGSRFQIWPDIEYSHDVPIYIDEKLASELGFL